MPRFVAPPPDIEGRKALEKRAREATRPQQPEEKGKWPFSAPKDPQAHTGSGPDTAYPFTAHSRDQS